MAKTLVRSDGEKAELWFRCEDLSATPTAPETKWEWRALSQPTPFADDADPDLHYDAVSGAYGDAGRKLTDGTSGTDDELGAGVVDDGSLGGFLQKLVDEAEARESVGAGERIPWLDVRLYVEWLTDTTYKITIRTLSYGSKRADPEDGTCQSYAASPTITIDAGYELDAADRGLEGTEGDVAWFVKTKVLDVIKAAESI